MVDDRDVAMVIGPPTPQVKLILLLSLAPGWNPGCGALMGVLLARHLTAVVAASAATELEEGSQPDPDEDPDPRDAVNAKVDHAHLAGRCLPLDVRLMLACV